MLKISKNRGTYIVRSLLALSSPPTKIIKRTFLSVSIIHICVLWRLIGESLRFPHFLVYLETSMSSKIVRETFLGRYSRKGNRNVKKENSLPDSLYNFLDAPSHFCQRLYSNKLFCVLSWKTVKYFLPHKEMWKIVYTPVCLWVKVCVFRCLYTYSYSESYIHKLPPNGRLHFCSFVWFPLL